LDVELLKPVLKSAECEPEKLRGAGDIPIRLLHCLENERSLQVFERDAFGREIEIEIVDLFYALATLNW